MKNLLTLTLLLSCIPHLQAGAADTATSIKQDVKQDVEEIVEELEDTKETPAPVTPQPVTKRSLFPTKKQQLVTPAPYTRKRRAAQPNVVAAPPIKRQKVVTLPANIVQEPKPPFVPSVMNPNVCIRNTDKRAFTIFTAQSAESGPNGFNQTTMTIAPHSSGKLPLTNQSQKFIGAQVAANDPMGESGMQTNILPIALRTPWAIVDNKGNAGEDDFRLQYVQDLEQHAAIIRNPSTQPYVLKIMNQFTEQIGIENTGSPNPAYMIRSIDLPALSEIPLALFNESDTRLHIECPANNQITKMNYPTTPGFYVVQEKQQEEIPRAAFNSNDFRSSTDQYLYLQING